MKASGREGAKSNRFTTAVLVLVCAACATGQSVEEDEGVPTPGTAPWEKVDTDLETVNTLGTQCTVFSMTLLEGVREPWVVAGDRLRMYFATAVTGTVGTVESADGIDWPNPRPVLLATQEWEGGWVGAPSVLVENGSWTMWYGAEGGIGLARSQDGVRWTKVPSPDGGEGPVFRADEPWEEGRVGSPSVRADPESAAGERYKMFYEGGDGNGVGYAISHDGVRWTRPLSNPVVGRGGDGEWDSDSVGSPHVLVEPGEAGRAVHRMWYTGRAGDDSSIGEAASYDGLAWLKNGFNPVLDEVPISQSAVAEKEPSVLPLEGTWMMWFAQPQDVPPARGICAATRLR